MDVITYAKMKKIDPTNLEPRMTAAETSLADKATKEELLSLSDGTPEAFADLTAIQTAYPTGSNYVKLNLADGYIYKWNGSSWVQGWLYQSSAPVKTKDIEVLAQTPTDLYDGRIWLLLAYSEVTDATTLAQNSVISGAAAYGDYAYMNDYVYIPTEPIALTKVDLKMTSRSSTLHTAANDIRVRLCRDDGTGLANLSDVLRTVILTGNPATPDTIFTATAVFADQSNNFANRINLEAGQRYHFVMDIPTGTGKSMYSGLINNAGSSSDKYAQCSYNTSWTKSENNIPSYAIYKAVLS
jgi:hypothetical protein